jgi:hypothetical protein
VLQTLVDQPSVAARVKTVVTLNSAAHGSEVADVLAQIADALERGDDACSTVPLLFRGACAALARRSPIPGEGVLRVLAGAMGLPLDTLEEFIRREDGVSAAPTVGAFFRRHAAGIRSLTTGDAARFWDERAGALPQNILYLSFRSVVSRRTQNLPLSNALFFDLLRLSSRKSPHNDMQVRLANQSLGGPVAPLEVVSPVAEGNHWQWELGPGDLPETAMPRAMMDRIPRAALLAGYYGALAELGLLE